MNSLLPYKIVLKLLIICTCAGIINASSSKLEWADEDTVIIEATREQDVPNLIFERVDEKSPSTHHHDKPLTPGENPSPDFRYGPPVIKARSTVISDPITCYSAHGDEGLCSTFQDCFPMLYYKDEEHMNEIKHPILAEQLKTNAGPCIPPPMSFRDDFVPGSGYYNDGSGNEIPLHDLICCPAMKSTDIELLKEQRTTQAPTTTRRTTTTTTTTTRRPPSSNPDDEDLDDYTAYSDPVPDAAAMMNMFIDSIKVVQPPSQKIAKKPPKLGKPKEPAGEEINIENLIVPLNPSVASVPEVVVAPVEVDLKTTDEQQQETKEPVVVNNEEQFNVVPVSVKTQASSEEQQQQVQNNPEPSETQDFADEPIFIPIPPSHHKYPEQQECGLINSTYDPPHPWIVAIQLDSKYMCTGSIIDNYHVLTAAHCVAHLSSVDVGRLRVYLGERILNSNVDGPTVIRKVSRAMRHRGYSISTLKNDIAILKLNLPIPINTNRVKPICLSKYGVSDDTVASISGWGTQWNDVEHDRLIENQFRIWPNEMCAEKYKQLTPDISISDDMLCAQYYHITSRNPHRQVSIYDVDSAGSPLVVRTPNGRYEQIGINSWRIRTNSSFPFVLTRITAFPEWIAKNVARR